MPSHATSPDGLPRCALAPRASGCVLAATPNDPDESGPHDRARVRLHCQQRAALTSGAAALMRMRQRAAPSNLHLAKAGLAEHRSTPAP